MTSQAEPKKLTKPQKMLLALRNEFRRRTKINPQTGKTYLDIPEEDQIWMQHALLTIYAEGIPQPRDLPPPTNLYALHYRLWPEEIPAELRETPEQQRQFEAFKAACEMSRSSPPDQEPIKSRPA